MNKYIGKIIIVTNMRKIPRSCAECGYYDGMGNRPGGRYNDGICTAGAMDFDCSGLYVCDPQKNTLCNKRNCGNPCTMTSHKEFAKDGGTDMNVQRAIEILNPAHREHYESIEPVDEACRMGIAALSYRVRKKPEYLPARPAPALACKRCGSVKHLHNADGAQNAFCGQCGQAIDWTDAAETDA